MALPDHNPKTSGGGRKSPASGDLEPGLYVVATPIGNARDVSLRALDVLNGCDVIAAEDTRVTAKLLAIHGVAKPLVSYNDHNGARERPKLLAKLSMGARIALVSDAGTPLVSDPGFKLVREALEKGLPVHAVPGPSAVLAALTLSGLPSDRFFFAGFLPAKSGERCSVLSELKALRATLIFFESPQRLAASLTDMRDVLGERQGVVARELTKLHEEVRRGSLSQLATAYADMGPPKGEVTILVGQPIEDGPDFDRIDRLLRQAIGFMPLRAAVDLVSDALSASRGVVYDRALLLKREAGDV